MGVFCSIVPLDGPAASEYQAYVTSVGIGLGIASGIHGILSSVFRGVFYVIGVFFIVVNGTWGFIGNLLGLMTHFASLYFYKDFGRHHEDSSRFCFVCYERGFSLKSNSAGRFAFSEGAVMSADTSSLRRHEAVHVFQHYIFGPVYL